jgi:hypothetical protein
MKFLQYQISLYINQNMGDMINEILVWHDEINLCDMMILVYVTPWNKTMAWCNKTMWHMNLCDMITWIYVTEWHESMWHDNMNLCDMNLCDRMTWIYVTWIYIT